MPASPSTTASEHTVLLQRVCSFDDVLLRSLTKGSPSQWPSFYASRLQTWGGPPLQRQMLVNSSPHAASTAQRCDADVSHRSTDHERHVLPCRCTSRQPWARSGGTSRRRASSRLSTSAPAARSGTTTSPSCGQRALLCSASASRALCNASHAGALHLPSVSSVLPAPPSAALRLVPSSDNRNYRSHESQRRLRAHVDVADVCTLLCG